MEKLSTDYKDAVQVIKTAILNSQLRAVKAVNQEQLALYYGIGRFVSENTRNKKWGSKAIETISTQLQIELPGLKGFSATNIKKMRSFYEQWQLLENRPPLADEIKNIDNQNFIINNAVSMLNSSPMAVDFNAQEFLSISFSHHDEILSKTNSVEERVFYIHQACINKWDKYTLRAKIQADLFHHQGTMTNNFSTTMTDSKQAFRAISMFKDEYLLDFMNVEQLGERDEDIDERVIENSIVQNVKNFIMTFGKGFSFIGNQVHFDKLGHDHWVDLLFYNRDLKSLVVFELKKGAFKPAYLGQLSAYLRILNDDERREGENPALGIILCKEADKAYVEYVIQDYVQPMGVATYKTTQERLKEVLPDEEELKKIL